MTMDIPNIPDQPILNLLLWIGGIITLGVAAGMIAVWAYLQKREALHDAREEAHSKQTAEFVKQTAEMTAAYNRNIDVQNRILVAIDRITR